MHQASKPKRRKRDMSEAEIFEIRQLIASGVKSAKDYPEVMELNDSDEDEATAAMVHKPADEALEDFEVSLPHGKRSCVYHMRTYSDTGVCAFMCLPLCSLTHLRQQEHGLGQ